MGGSSSSCYGIAGRAILKAARVDESRHPCCCFILVALFSLSQVILSIYKISQVVISNDHFMFVFTYRSS